MDDATFNSGDMLQGTKELGKGQVAYLAAPHLDHALEVQCLKDKNIVLVGQVMRQFEKPVPTLVGNAPMLSGKIAFGPFSAFRSSLLAGKRSIQLANFVQRLLEEKRGFNAVCLLPVVYGQEVLQPKVESCDFTRHGFRLRDFYLYRKAGVQIAQIVPFDCQSLDLAQGQAVINQLVGMLADSDFMLRHPLPTRLLKRVAFGLGYLAESRRRGLDTVFEIAKEKLVTFFNALHDVLQRLGGDQFEPGVFGELLKPGKMLHQDVLIQVLAGQFVVATVESYRVIVRSACKLNHSMKMLILFVSIEFDLVGFPHWPFLE